MTEPASRPQGSLVCARLPRVRYAMVWFRRKWKKIVSCQQQRRNARKKQKRTVGHDLLCYYFLVFVCMCQKSFCCVKSPKIWYQSHSPFIIHHSIIAFGAKVMFVVVFADSYSRANNHHTFHLTAKNLLSIGATRTHTQNTHIILQNWFGFFLEPCPQDNNQHRREQTTSIATNNHRLARFDILVHPRSH